MKIQVKGTQTHSVEVTVDALDAAKVAANTLLQMYGLGGLNSGTWVSKDGDLCEEIDYGHGTPGTKVLGKATEQQKQAYRIAHDFMELFRATEE